MAASLSVESPEAVKALGMTLYDFDAGARIRGAQLYNRGEVSLKAEGEQTIQATVGGSTAVKTRLDYVEGQWLAACSCRQRLCSHLCATVLAWLGHVSNAERARKEEAKAAPSSTAVELAASLQTDARKLTFRQEWEQKLPPLLGRSLTREEGALLGRIASLFHTFRMRGAVYGTDVAQLGIRSNAVSRPYGPVYQEWWQTPPRDPLELWQYVAYDIETSGQKIPEFMRPVTDTAPIRKFAESKARRETIVRWKDRFASLAYKAQQPVGTPVTREPELLDLRVRVSADDWIAEMRHGPDAPWKVLGRTYSDRLANHTGQTLANIVATPPVYAFIGVLQEHYRRHYTSEIRRGGYHTAELMHALLSHPLARTLVADGAGTPLTFAEQPLVWQVARAENAADYEVKLTLPDGGPLPPSASHLPGSPDLYLFGRHVYRGPPALDGTSASGAVVPAEVIEEAETLQVLHLLNARLPDEIEQRFITVPLRARVEFGLYDDEYSGEYLVVRLHAVSEKPRVESEYGLGSWDPKPDPHKKSPGYEKGKIYTCDLRVPNEVASRLPDLKVSHNAYGPGWSRRLTRNVPEELLAWREALPAGVEVVATGELASLLDGPVKAKVDFELLESDAHRDWFDLALALKPEDSSLTPEEIALLLKARGKLVRLPGKGWRRLHVEIEGASADALEAAGFDREAIAEAALAGEKHRFHALQLAQSKVADLLPQRQAEALRTRAQAIAMPQPPAVPAALRAELRPYQIEGYHFLAFLSANRLGGVLADDMGLGKTVQTLAWLLWLHEQRPADAPLRALVVCPKSVVGNWEAEAVKFAPTVQVVRFTPTLASTNDAKQGAVAPVIVVANYTQLRLNAEFFTGRKWHVVVLDEGQFIKNPTARVAQVARDLPGEHRLILTGTPIENRLLDLWSLFSFSLPGLLGAQAAFKRHYAQDNPLALTRLRARVRHFLLRRTKAQVATDLPPRTEEDVVVELEGDQAKLYQAELKRARAELLKLQTARQLDQARFNVLASLLRLRQICCHPALVSPEHAEVPSAKLDELLERLEALRDEGHQVLVFSQFVQMLELIRGRLEKAGIGHLMLTGQTENREELVRQFQSDKRNTVFLLSLKAAGFGLNLTAASYVILYDPWWNPAVEAQAIDRTHRIGQSSPVIAYRLIARGTVEEKIRALQREKAALAGAIVQEESLASVLDLDSLKQILS